MCYWAICFFLFFDKKYRLFKKIGDSMFKRLFLIVTIGVTLSGCFMAPMALVGPVTSGFSTASIVQSGISSGASYMVKKSTGKTISEHIMDSINDDVLKQTYAPKNKNKVDLILPKSKPSKL